MDNSSGRSEPDHSIGVFINYRREDTSGHAGRLHDYLSDHLPRDRVFMDVASIDPGDDFTAVIHRDVGSCDVLIAVIGRQWLTSSDARGRRRIDNAADLVRTEIEAALVRGIRVIPVLVQGAEMPGSDELPERLASLASRNALEVADSRWRYDIGKLIAAIEKVRAERTRAAIGGEPAEDDAGNRSPRQPGVEAPPHPERGSHAEPWSDRVHSSATMPETLEPTAARAARVPPPRESTPPVDVMRGSPRGNHGDAAPVGGVRSAHTEAGSASGQPWTSGPPRAETPPVESSALSSKPASRAEAVRRDIGARRRLRSHNLRSAMAAALVGVVALGAVLLLTLGLLTRSSRAPGTPGTTSAPLPAPHPVTPVEQLLPDDVTGCESFRIGYALLTNAARTLACVDRALVGGSSVAYQFRNATDLEGALKTLNRQFQFDPSSAGDQCPPEANVQGRVQWGSAAHPDAPDQVLQCLTFSGHPCYMWTIPRDNAIFTVSAQTWSGLDSWWHSHAVPGAVVRPRVSSGTG